MKISRIAAQAVLSFCLLFTGCSNVVNLPSKASTGIEIDSESQSFNISPTEFIELIDSRTEKTVQWLESPISSTLNNGIQKWSQRLLYGGTSFYVNLYSDDNKLKKIEFSRIEEFDPEDLPTGFFDFHSQRDIVNLSSTITPLIEDLGLPEYVNRRLNDAVEAYEQAELMMDERGFYKYSMKRENDYRVICSLFEPLTYTDLQSGDSFATYSISIEPNETGEPQYLSEDNSTFLINKGSTQGFGGLTLDKLIDYLKKTSPALFDDSMTIEQMDYDRDVFELRVKKGFHRGTSVSVHCYSGQIQGEEYVPGNILSIDFSFCSEDEFVDSDLEEIRYFILQMLRSCCDQHNLDSYRSREYLAFKEQDTSQSNFYYDKDEQPGWFDIKYYNISTTDGGRSLSYKVDLH